MSISIIPENMVTSLGCSASGDHMNNQKLCRTDSAPHWLRCSGELAPSFSCSITCKSWPFTLARQRSGAGPGGRDVGELASRLYERAEHTAHVLWSGMDTELMPSYPLPPEAVGKAAHRVVTTGEQSPPLTSCGTGERALYLTWTAQGS